MNVFAENVLRFTTLKDRYLSTPMPFLMTTQYDVSKLILSFAIINCHDSTDIITKHRDYSIIKFMSVSQVIKGPTN